MKPFTKFSSIVDHIESTVSILGWVDKIRVQKKRSFISLRSGLESIQIVVDLVTIPHDSTGFVTDITQESYVKITGIVRKLPEGAYSVLPVELHATDVTVFSKASSEYPSKCPTDSGPEVKLEQRHLLFRHHEFALFTKLRSQLIQALRRHFEESDCTEIIPPSFTGVECEGGATLFKVEHPGKSSDKPMTAFLTQSSQFALEMALPGVSDCFCIAPSFRAEHSHTRRHLTEFLHAEAEWAGIISFDDHLQKLRELLQGTLKHFLTIAEKTLIELGLLERVQGLEKMTHDIMVLDHKDAIIECTKRGIYKDPETQEPFGPRDDIPEAQERALIDAIGKIVFLVRFPKEFKSFYMGLDPDDPSRVLGCDVEVPSVGEIVGSGVREGDYDRLYQRLLDQKLVPDDYREYLDLRKFGFGQTSGMGLGVDRMLTWLTGQKSIRDVTSFPRFPGYLRP